MGVLLALILVLLKVFLGFFFGGGGVFLEDAPYSQVLHGLDLFSIEVHPQIVLLATTFVRSRM